MIDIKKHFLKTKMSQKTATEFLVAKLTPMLDECVYNVKRYHAPISLILLYTEDEIADFITEHKRLTDVKNTIQLEGSYFNFVFLPFTDLKDSFSLINHIEYHIPQKTKVFSSANKIEADILSYYTFINDYLTVILQKEEGNFLAY